MKQAKELSIAGRTAIAVMMLLERPTQTNEVAKRLEISRQGALFLLYRISEVMPIYLAKNPITKKWEWHLLKS